MLKNFTDKERDFIFFTDYNCFGKFANILAYRSLLQTYISEPHPLIKKVIYSQLHQLFCSSLEDYAHFLSALRSSGEKKQSFLREFSKINEGGVNFPSLLKKNLSYVEMLKFLGLNSKDIPRKISLVCGERKPKDFLTNRFSSFRNSIEHFSMQKDGRQIIYVKHKHGKVLVSSNTAYFPNENDLGFTAISFSEKRDQYECMTVNLDEEMLGLFYTAMLDIIDQIRFLSLCFILRNFGVKKINDFIVTNNKVSDPIEEQLKVYWRSLPAQYFPKKVSP
jgi:hypothetical protein